MLYREVKEYLGNDWIAFNELFRQSLRSEMLLLNQINAYVLKNSGKQLRPILALLIGRAISGVCNDKVLRCAVATELVHTATLLHDDVADNSPTRRGSATVMSLYSPTASVLVGDFWLSRGIDLILSKCDNDVIGYFSRCLADLAEGEMLQLEKASSLDATEEDYNTIIFRKTASLFKASMMSAAHSADASAVQMEAVASYSFHIGMAFQMMDDIFDYSPRLNTGKPVGVDILEKKFTLPFFGFLRNAPSEISSKFVERMRFLDAHSVEDEKQALARDAIELVERYEGLDYAYDRLEQEINKAVTSLSVIDDSPARDYLVAFARYMSVREH